MNHDVLRCLKTTIWCVKCSGCCCASTTEWAKWSALWPRRTSSTAAPRRTSRACGWVWAECEDSCPSRCRRKRRSSCANCSGRWSTITSSSSIPISSAFCAPTRMSWPSWWTPSVTENHQNSFISFHFSFFFFLLVNSIKVFVNILVLRSFIRFFKVKNLV